MRFDFIYKFILLFLKMKLENLRNLLSFIWKMIKFPKFNNLDNLWTSEKLSDTLSVQVIF